MRPSSLLVLALATSFSLAACGGDEPSSSGPDPATGGVAPAGDGGTFPAVVDHKFGTTTVPERPERVVSVGLTEQDTLLQLGVTPVAVTEWYGERPHATWPWATDLLGDAEPEVLSAADGFEFERIAALDPDLIIGVNAGVTESDYELLSEIAPTVPSVKGATPYFSDWQDQTLQIARALGREDDGRQLVDDVDARFAEVAGDHPEWEGMSATFSQGAPYDGQLYVYPDGLNTEFLTDLGFVITPGLERYSPEEGTQAQISAENVALLDADVIVFATEQEENFDALQEFGTVSDLAAVRENRAVYTDDVLAGAIYFITPLSLDFVLDELTPLLERATAGRAPRAFPS